MPEMDGWDFLDAFDQLPDEVTDGIAVVLFSVSDAAMVLLRCRNTGHPVDVVCLWARVLVATGTQGSRCPQCSRSLA